MPHGLQIVSSNRLEALAERLAAAVAAPRSGDPLAPEWIVVQSRGMARWVQLELARRAGICALTTFSFPRDFLWTIGRIAAPEAVQDPRFERDALTWRIWDGLERMRDDPAFAETSRYAGSDPGRRFEIASRIATAFDQYLVYRPDLIAAWEEGQDSDWQAVLWRAVSGGGHPWHEAHRLRATTECLRTAAPQGLPERTSWFAIAALPPAYLDVLSALALHSEVTLYTLQPSDQYWGDLLPRRAAARLEPESISAPEGPRLLVSLGRLGRSFQRQLAEHGAGGGGDPFEDPGDGSLLRAVQSDLLHLRRPQPEDTLGAPSPADPSLRIHSCHSPRRELEVLHDQILDALDHDPTLGPGDILVLTPDIEAYAPQIHAVFGAPEDERLRLPYTVADRVPRAESRIADAFLRLLRLPEGRCGRSDIEPLLESPAIQRRFGWTPAAVSQLQERIESLGIRWGLDAAHRARLGLPAFPQGTWRHGSDRLLLGMAMAEGDEALLHGISPAPGVEGDAVEAAAGLASFLGAVQRLMPWHHQEHRLSEWTRFLEQALADFLEPGPDEQDEAQWLRDGIARLGNISRDAAADPRVPLA
ncbi:MAG: exodeoxyribonuclease V subunit gamma, partial [Verrucomicrobiae bacterium]|nr:exodeoxyribonuclease V subunit gamma [Verrucomicrobiae bacterium]